MKLTNLSVKDLITQDATLTFLVGAGCSINAPSCLPAGRAMMDAIIRHTCPDSEIEKIMALEELRFEALVELYRDQFDRQLRIIDYYGLCDKPNLQHFFIAERIKQGNFVMTTNFDFLIEHSLLQLGIKKDEIIPVITKEDFIKYNNPGELYRQGYKTLYKIHGSPKNLITNQDTKDSLVATIQAFGSNKEGMNVFQVEPFKRELFDNISNNRSLVVIGYSGSDDFDVVPTLKVLKNLNNVIWINFITDDEGREKIYEIDEHSSSDPNSLDKINEILVDIYRRKCANHVYRVEANTSRLLRELLNIEYEIDPSYFSLKPSEWLNKINPSPNDFDKYDLCSVLYNEFNKYEDALRCAEKAFRIAKQSNDQDSEAFALTQMSYVHFRKGNYVEARKFSEKALDIFFELGNKKLIAQLLSFMAEIDYNQGNYPKALEKLQESLKISDEIGDIYNKRPTFGRLGIVYYELGNYPLALDYFEKGLKLAEKFGVLIKKSAFLNNIANVYDKQGKFEEALDYYEQALKIAEQLSDLRSIGTLLSNKGITYSIMGNMPKSIECYNKALELSDSIGDKSGKLVRLINIAERLNEEKKYSESLRYKKEALLLAEELNDRKNKSHVLCDMGITYYAQKKYDNAAENCKKALEIARSIKHKETIAYILIKLGMIYKDKENYPIAMEYLNKSIEVSEEIKDFRLKREAITNYGHISYRKGNYDDALKYYNEALRISESLGVKYKCMTLIDIGGLYKKQKALNKALEFFEEALSISRQINM